MRNRYFNFGVSYIYLGCRNGHKRKNEGLCGMGNMHHKNTSNEIKCRQYQYEIVRSELRCGKVRLQHLDVSLDDFE